MMHSPFAACALLAVTLPLLGAHARETSPARGEERVYGGSATAGCAWPTAVMLVLNDGQTACSGTLVDPNIVVYAAHCGTDVDSILMGNNAAQTTSAGFVPLAPERTLQPAHCAVYPGHTPQNGTDFAYCSLQQPVTDVPIVPILMGCESAALDANKAVVLVGFGLDANQTVGVKHDVTTVAAYLESNKAFVGGDGNATCNGDSGGPAFLQLTASDPLTGHADDAWRVFGITSYGLSTTCGGGAFDSLMDVGVPWLEADSGIDITPCTDANGAWNPSPACGNFPLHPDARSGDWSNGCTGGAATALAATCGPPYAGALRDVHIVDPNGSSRLDAATGLTVAVQASTETGNAAPSVSVSLDGNSLPLQQQSGTSFTFGPAPLAAGAHRIVAVARAGGVSQSQELLLTASNVAAGGCAGTEVGGWLVAGSIAALGMRRRRGLGVVSRRAPGAPPSADR